MKIYRQNIIQRWHLLWVNIIAVDNTVLQYVRRSAFTNSISSFYVAKAATNEYSIFPESSLSLLACADSGKLLANKNEKKIKEEFVEAVWNDLKTNILSKRGTTAKGQVVLEDIFPRVLRMRLLSTHLKGRKKRQSTLMELFAIDINSIMCTVGSRPYNAANTSSCCSSNYYSFKQEDGVDRSAKDTKIRLNSSAIRIGRRKSAL